MGKWEPPRIMNRSLVLRRAAAGTAIAAAVVVATLPVRAQPAAQSPVPAVAPPACSIPAEFARFDLPLRRTARALAAGRPLKIVAIGSSSTAGTGASSPYHTYPSQLAAALAREFVDHDITVINRG